MTPDIAIESTRLPGVLHGDPADRIMIATARAMGASLMTCDRAILHYANAGHLRAFDASVIDE
jgi:PIN domain nuclease of toxin-antitoxin system